jgi:hypothetical protein
MCSPQPIAIRAPQWELIKGLKLRCWLFLLPADGGVGALLCQKGFGRLRSLLMRAGRWWELNGRGVKLITPIRLVLWCRTRSLAVLPSCDMVLRHRDSFTFCRSLKLCIESLIVVKNYFVDSAFNQIKSQIMETSEEFHVTLLNTYHIMEVLASI